MHLNVSLDVQGLKLVQKRIMWEVTTMSAQVLKKELDDLGIKAKVTHNRVKGEVTVEILDKQMAEKYSKVVALQVRKLDRELKGLNRWKI